MFETITASFTCKPGNCTTRREKRVLIQGDIRIPVIGRLSGGKIRAAGGRQPVRLVH